MLAGVTVLVACDFLGSALCDNVATMLSTFRAEIKHPIGALDYVEVVFNDDHRVAITSQSQKNFDELVDIGHRQSCSRFIENIHCVFAGGTV